MSQWDSRTNFTYSAVPNRPPIQRRGESLGIFQLIGLIVTVLGVVIVILSGARARVDGGVFWKGIALAFVTSIFWAINSFAISQGGKDLSAWVGNTVRMVIAIGISFGIGKAMLPGSPICLPVRELKRWFWLFALEAFGGSYFFMYGLSHSPLAIASTLSSLAPVISVPVAWYLGMEKFSPLRMIGVCLVVAGIWALLGGAS